MNEKMNENGKTIPALEAEMERLRAELERAGQREQDLADTRRAMLYLLEDINDGAALTEKAKKEWEATFDSISDLLFIHGPDMRITRCNRAYKEAAGLKFKEIIGRPYYEVFPRMDGPFELCKAEGDGGAQEQETDVPSLGKVFKTRFYFIRAMDKVVYSIHVMDDITEQKRSEEKIAQEVELTRHLLMIATATAHTTDIDRLMEQVVGCLKNIMRSDLSLSYLWDKERNAFMPCRADGLTHAQVPFFRVEHLDLNSRFVARALEERKTIIENFGAEYAGLAWKNTMANPAAAKGGGKPGIPEAAPLHWVEDINTAVVFPLLGREGYLGLLLGVYAGSKGLPAFGERDREVWDGISFQVSTALDEARLYKESIDRTMELSRKVETIRTMHEIDTAILSAVHPEGILDTAARMVGKAVFCDRATIALVDREKECFIYEAGFGISLKKGSLVDFNDTSATEVVKTGMPQYVANFRESGKTPALEKKFLDEGFLSHIRVPLIVKGEVVGVLTAGARRAAAYSAEDLSIMEKLASQIGIALENAKLLTDIEELFLGTVKTLSEVIDAKSPWTRGHSERVTAIALDIGRALKLKEDALKNLEVAGLLHDIGKLGTYESILDKPGKLTEEEQDIMRQHPAKGADILAPIRQLARIIPAIRHHHEFYDGTGYPDGLKGEGIPFPARILAVADTVDAMGADRPYRKGKPMSAIVAELKRCSGTQFDPVVVGAFLKTEAAAGP